MDEVDGRALAQRYGALYRETSMKGPSPFSAADLLFEELLRAHLGLQPR